MSTVIKNGVVYYNGIDLSGFLQSINTDGSTNLLDSTALNSTGYKTFEKGLSEFAVNGEGFFISNPIVGALDVDGLFKTALEDAGNQILTVGVMGAALGQLAVLMNVKQSKHQVSEKPGDLIMATFEAKSAKGATGKPYVRGMWLYKGSPNALTNTPSYDSGASNNTSILVHTHNVGPVSANVTVQHSTDNAVWIDLIALTAVASNAALRSEFSGVVNRYIRAIVTPAGGTAQVGIAIRVNY